MTTSSERPTARTRPRPAHDEGIDPIAPLPVAPAATATAHAVAPLLEPHIRRGPEPTVQLNVRVASDVSALINQQVNTTGRTKRQLIEQAIRQLYS